MSDILIRNPPPAIVTFPEESVLVGSVVIGLSVLFQLLSAIIAASLIKTTKKRIAWLLVAAAIALMTLRRVESLMNLLSGEVTKKPDLVFEATGLVVSAIILAGVYLIRPIFSTLARSEAEQRSLNAKLTALSEEQRILLEYSKDFIYRHDPSGVITYVSPSVERITGYSPQEWLAHFSHHYTDNPVNRNGRASTEEMLRTGEAGPPYIIEVHHKNGSRVWLEINKQPYHIDGNVAGFIGVARDITKRVGLELERERLIDDLQDALAKIKTLKGMLPICASCKKVRDDSGYWKQIEAYVSDHSDAEFTHAICPECARKLYPGYCKET